MLEIGCVHALHGEATMKRGGSACQKPLKQQRKREKGIESARSPARCSRYRKWGKVNSAAHLGMSLSHEQAQSEAYGERESTW